MNNAVFSKKIALPVSADEAFAWHERPGALERLIPPWENVRIVKANWRMRFVTYWDGASSLAFLMFDDLAVDQVDNVFGDISGEVGDAFEVS